MKYCSKCGKELADEAVVCVGCGFPVNTAASKQSMIAIDENAAKKETFSFANCALIYAFLIPIVGLILGIIGLVKCKTIAFNNKFTIAVIASVSAWAFYVLIIAGIYYWW